MRGRGSEILVLLLIGLFLAGAAVSTAGAADAPKISKDGLKSQMGDPNVVIIDVRAEGDWKPSAKKIKGAVRENPSNVEAWMDEYAKDKTIILYCA
jgi:predicted sulfurtransferase